MDPRHGPVPMILGVTGHRDLRPQDVDVLRDVVRGVLNRFRERYPSTRLIVFSSLAEGADRLVAREALDLGLSLVAPLPFEPHDFEKDFATPESIAEFRDLIGRADESFVVPAPPASSAGRELDSRDRGYAACSAFVVRRCVELIALWDGVAAPLRGTAEAVAPLNCSSRSSPSFSSRCSVSTRISTSRTIRSGRSLSISLSARARLALSLLRNESTGNLAIRIIVRSPKRFASRIIGGSPASPSRSPTGTHRAWVRRWIGSRWRRTRRSTGRGDHPRSSGFAGKGPGARRPSVDVLSEGARDVPAAWRHRQRR